MSDSEETNKNKWAGRLRRKNIDIKKAEGSKRFAKKSWKQERRNLFRTPPARSIVKTPSPPRILLPRSITSPNVKLDVFVVFCPALSCGPPDALNWNKLEPPNIS